MGYFDGLIEGNFKTAADGRRLFYPWGGWGKGRVLTHARTEQRIRRFLKAYYMVLLPVSIAAVIALQPSGFYYALALIPVFMLVYSVGLLSLTRTLPITPERLSWSESWANSGRAHGRTVLWSLFIISVLFTISGIWLILKGEVGIGLLSILFFGGVCGTKIGYMLRMRA